MCSKPFAVQRGQAHVHTVLPRTHGSAKTGTPMHVVAGCRPCTACPPHLKACGSRAPVGHIACARVCVCVMLTWTVYITEREYSQTGNPKNKVTNQLLACLNTQHSPSGSWQLTPGNQRERKDTQEKPKSREQLDHTNVLAETRKLNNA